MLPFKRILCPTDFSQPAEAALERALELIKHFGAELLLLNVVPPFPTVPAATMPDGALATAMVPEGYRQDILSASRQALERIVQDQVPAEVRVRNSLQEGDPAQQIIKTAQDEGADLIVIATHGQTGWRHWVFGSVTERVVREASCPVLTIRRPEGEE